MRLRSSSYRGGRPRFVRWAKPLFPLIAILLVLFVVVWSRIRLDETQVKIEDGVAGQVADETGSGKAVNIVTYDGKDDKGRDVHLAAKAVVGDGDNFKLVNPVGTIDLSKDRWAGLRSERGYYWKSEKKIDFMDKVVLFRSDGMTFDTEAATMDLSDGIYYGEAPVQGSGPDFEVQSERGFRLLDEGQIIVFFGRSQATVFAKEKGAEE